MTKLKKIAQTAFIGITLIVSACTSQYEMTAINRTRILIDQRFDTKTPSKEVETAINFLQPYKARVDSLMQPVIGQTAHYMYADIPESPLSNLLPDILMWAGKKYGETPDFAIYNIGGIRAALAEGDVTIGDIYAIAPFENKICFLTLSGKAVQQLFEEIASTKGQGVSREVKIKISKNVKLKSATIKGEPIDPSRSYRIATIDYVAQGNDNMTAFRQKTNTNQPQGDENNVRVLIIDYFKQKTQEGKKVGQQIEGRITIEK